MTKREDGSKREDEKKRGWKIRLRENEKRK